MIYNDEYIVIQHREHVICFLIPIIVIIKLQVKIT